MKPTNLTKNYFEAAKAKGIAKARAQEQARSRSRPRSAPPWKVIGK